MIWFKYLWVVILIIYIIVLSVYTYFAFKDELERNRESTPEDDIINPHKKFTEKYDVMQACSDFFLDHITVIGIWATTLIILFIISIVYCFATWG